MRHLPFYLGLMVVFFAVQVPCHAEVKVLAKGDYSSKSTQVQQFVATINLEDVDNTMPFTLNFENGHFQWVRVFLSDSAGAARVSVNAQPQGYMIVSENSFKRNASVAVDMTGRIRRGNTTLLIRGAGMPGSTFKWSLTTVTGMRITVVEPKVVQAGGTVTITGAGFSPSVAANSLSFNEKKGKVTDATEDTIKGEVPDTLVPGKYSVQVTANGVKSNAVPINVSGVPEVTNMSLQCQRSMSPVTIYGKNFSEQIKDNEVKIGGQKAEITSAATDSLTFTVPLMPEADGGYFFNPPRQFDVSVKVGNVSCKSKQQLYIGPYQW
jgi:hypothetical protein